jgi:uncharacterized protein DUF6229
MNNTLGGADVVAQWRNGNKQSPAGPLFASGQFAEADIVNATAEITWACSGCSGSHTWACC